MAQAESRQKKRVPALLIKFVKFMGASGTSTLVDLFVFYALRKWVLPAIWPEGVPFSLPFLADTGIFLATAVARVCSATVNFLLNRNFVFRFQGRKGTVWKYILLCVCVMLADAVLVGWLTSLLPASPSAFVTTLIKAGVDTALFFVSFFVQKTWVFPQQKTEE